MGGLLKGLVDIWCFDATLFSSVQFSSVHVILKFHIIQLQAKLIKKIQNTHKRLQHTETNKHKELLYKGIS